MKKWLILQNFGQIFKLFAFFKEKKGLIFEKFGYKARETLKILKKNWWFFGISFEKLAKNGQILQNFLLKCSLKTLTILMKKINFPFFKEK